MKYLFSLILLLPLLGFSQVRGVISDAVSKEKIPGARVQTSSGQNTLSDEQGRFSLTINQFPVQLKFSMNGFVADSVMIYQDTIINVELFQLVQEIKTVVVSASRSDQNLEEVPVSMEIIRPALFDNKAMSSLEQVADQTPGVFTMDGQVSIRGGGGYSYGAGSRVLALWNGIPMVSPDVGDIKWNAIPLEQCSQIEVIKGASSVLYGSGALNGTIALTEKEPGTKGELKAKIQSGIYGDPRRASLRWWDKNPTFQMAEVYYGKMKGNLAYTVGINGFRDQGYRQTESELRGRINGSVFYRFTKVRIKAGLSYNLQYQDVGLFILWHSDSLAYQPQEGATSQQRSIRLNIDPYIKYIDKWNNRHSLKTRYYQVTTGDSKYIYTSAKAEMFYADYQFQRVMNKGNLVVGATNNTGLITSTVFDDHVSNSAALYGQIDKKIWDLDLSGGMRLEYFQQDDREPDSEWKGLPFYPIFRVGAHYKVHKATHLRASYGQGIRFPSVAERYVATSTGGVVIFPNPELRPEIGWSAELGAKQVFKIGDWRSMFDIAAFINEYSNMIEFTFGLYNPDGYPPTIDWLGFQAQNAEAARITGIEASFNSSGKIKNVEIISLIGYTYMNPVSLNEDPEYVYGTTGIGGFSDTSSNMLKYRFNHLAKLDVESNYKSISCGLSVRYNSFMRNIDAVFLQDLDPTSQVNYILPGLKEYRDLYNDGNIVLDLRAAYTFKDTYRIGLVVNNAMNSEYTSRPGDIQAPRNFIVQFVYHVQ